MKEPDHDEVLDKLDALLNKHRTPRQPAATTPPVTNTKPAVNTIPVLTEVVGHIAKPDAIPVLTQIVIPSESTAETMPPAEQNTTHATTESSRATHANLNRTIAENLEQRIMPQLTKHIDQSLESLLAQFKEEIAQLVRESLAQELQQYFDVIVSDLQRHSNDHR